MVARGFRWLDLLRRADPVNLYIALTSAGIVWVGGLGLAFYRNPLTDDRANIFGVFSFSFVRSWIVAHPIGSRKMTLTLSLIHI